MKKQKHNPLDTDQTEMFDPEELRKLTSYRDEEKKCLVRVPAYGQKETYWVMTPFKWVRVYPQEKSDEGGEV